MSATIQWDRQLIKRYGHAASSCSGYPQISQLQSGFASLDLLRVLRNGHRPLQLAISLPPLHTASIEVYLDCLAREVNLLSCHIAADQPVQRLHLSSGAADARQLQQLLTHVRQRFNIQASTFGDDSVQVDPTQADWARMGVLRDLGFNHVSIGVADAGQSAAEVVVDFRDPRRTRWLIEAARTLDFASVNIDLGYGRAWQSLASFKNKLAAIIELQPNRILLFDYAQPPPRYWASQRFKTGKFASPCDKYSMYQHAVEQLDAAGYCYIGLGQFALKDDPLISAREDGMLRCNWLGYSDQTNTDLLGIGVAALSQIGTLQLQNQRDLSRYQAQLANHQLAVFYGRQSCALEQIQGLVSEALCCDLPVDLQALEVRFGRLFSDYFAACRPALEQMAADGLLQLSHDSLRILPAGRLLVGAVCKVLAAGANRTHRRAAAVSRCAALAVGGSVNRCAVVALR